MKYLNIASHASKSAITPSFIGFIAMILEGVLPSILFASPPTATTSLVFVFIATIEGSIKTTPLPLTKTQVFAVPRSIPISFEKKFKNFTIYFSFNFPVLLI